MTDPDQETMVYSLGCLKGVSMAREQELPQAARTFVVVISTVFVLASRQILAAKVFLR